MRLYDNETKIYLKHATFIIVAIHYAWNGYVNAYYLDITLQNARLLTGKVFTRDVTYFQHLN